MRTLSKLILTLSVLTLISCGGEKKDENKEESFTIGDTQNTQTTTTTNSEANTSNTSAADSDAEAGDVVELTISGNDQMRFDKEELKVKAGQTVRLTLVHSGQMAKNVMGHNWVLLTKGTDINEFGQQAASAADNDYIPANTNAVVVHTDLIGGGQTTTIEFTAPAAGTYDFICSFPGHYSIMRGKFIVE